MEETRLQKLYWETVSINDRLSKISNQIHKRVVNKKDYSDLMKDFIEKSLYLNSVKNEMKSLETQY